MNHLRQLLEAPRDSLFTVDRKHFDAAHKIFSDAAASAVCFDLGEASALESLGFINELCVLPYKTCWFECMVNDHNPMLLGLLAHQHASGLISMFAWAKQGPRWIYLFAADMPNLTPDSSALVVYPDEGRDSFYYYTKCIAAFLSALHCTNIRRERHDPPPKLQKARAKRGKAPLFSYWTLQLDGKTERGDDQGGTHATPRVHLRRGHPRQYAQGKWTWVQPCAVGNRAAGMVHKDYTAGPALLVPAR